MTRRSLLAQIDRRLEDVCGTGAAAIISGSRRSVHRIIGAFEALDHPQNPEVWR